MKIAYFKLVLRDETTEEDIEHVRSSLKDKCIFYTERVKIKNHDVPLYTIEKA